MHAIKEKIVLVVGGAGAIGSAISEIYAKNNFSVIIADLNRSEGIRVCQEIEGTLEFYEVDVTDSESIEQLRIKIQNSQNSIDRLISLAGGAFVEEFSGISGISDKIISQSITLNLTSHLWLIREFLPLMHLDLDPSIVLVSSINALKDFGLPAYSAAKAGLLGAVYSLSGELGCQGIRINAVLPGTVDTSRTRQEPKNFKRLQMQSALGRLTTTREIATCVYVLTEFMTPVTGQAIVADCGQVVKGINEMF